MKIQINIKDCITHEQRSLSKILLENIITMKITDHFTLTNIEVPVFDDGETPLTCSRNIDQNCQFLGVKDWGFFPHCLLFDEKLKRRLDENVKPLGYVIPCQACLDKRK